MELQNIGGYSTIDEFVEAKLQKLENAEHSFKGIYPLMFSESTNILYERSTGYRIQKTTYGQCRENIEKKTVTLEKKLAGVPANSVIAVCMDNCVEWIETFWIVLRAGYCPLFLNMRLDDAVLEEALRSADAKAVISDGKQFDLPTILLSEITPAEDAEVRQRDGEKQGAPFGEAIFVMSSGTSEHVKICAYTGEEFTAIIKNAREIVKDSPLMKKHYEGELKLLCFLPFYHIFGLVAVYTWFAFFSRTFVELKDMAPETILNTIRRHKVTHIFAVPLFWDKVYSEAVSTIKKRGDKTYEQFEKGLKIVDKLEGMEKLSRAFSRKAFKEVRDNLFGESISFMISGGGSIRPEVLRFFNGIGYHLSNGYGMTEIGITSVELSDSPKILNSGSVGKPLSSVRYRVSEDGEMQVSGESLAHYIIVDGKRTERAEWFDTKDLAREENGRYYVLGRQDDLIVGPSGENLNPNLLEPKLIVPGVREAALLGVKDGSGTVVPTLLLSVNRFSTKEKLQEIREAARLKLEELKLSSEVRRILFTGDELIQGSEFKLNRIRLAREIQSGELALLDPENAAVEASPEDDPLFLRVRAIFAAAVQKEAAEVPFTADFFLDLGGTSLDYFAMVSGLQNEFGVTIPTEGGSSLSSLKEIYEYIKTGL